MSNSDPALIAATGAALAIIGGFLERAEIARPGEFTRMLEIMGAVTVTEDAAQGHILLGWAAMSGQADVRRSEEPSAGIC